ncbi:hypothetical protein [Roseivirga sp. E12]|uniref:hypothetical protein n=1 Tax=Roseivirga sp. E12 TaxID=2819237 RepID=UPI001ABC082C|nr:hypothetical protein [Roseivirga sp. E12]MBO3699816.1 hypothetical protein [Roseivirga sp. E12]
MRTIALFILVILSLQSCGVEQTKGHEGAVKSDTIRTFTNSSYGILITKSKSTQETGSSEGPQSLRFLNKELKEVIKTSLESIKTLASFENLKMAPEIISVDFNTFENLGLVSRDSILLHEVLDAYGLDYERDSIQREGYWLRAKSDVEELSEELYFSSVSSSSSVGLKGATAEDLLKSLSFNYSGRFFGIDVHNSAFRYDLEYRLRDIESVLDDLKNAFHVNDTIIKVQAFRFFRKEQH